MNRPPDDPSDNSRAPNTARVGGEPPHTAIEPLPPRRSIGRKVVALLVSQSCTWFLDHDHRVDLAEVPGADIARSTSDRHVGVDDGRRSGGPRDRDAADRRGRPQPAHRQVPHLLRHRPAPVDQQIDTIVLSLLVDRDAIRWYATADVLFGSLLFVPVILTTSLFPAMAERYARDPFEVQVMLNRVVRSLLLVAVPIGLATLIVSRSFVSVLYGPRYEESGPVLEVFGILVILSSLTIVLGRYAMATERVRFWSVLIFTTIVISIPRTSVLPRLRASLVTYAVVLLVVSTFDDDERQYAARASRDVWRVLGRAT